MRSGPVVNVHYHGTVIQDQQHRERLLADLVSLERGGRIPAGTFER